MADVTPNANPETVMVTLPYWLLDDVARSMHQTGQLYSKGHLHPGAFSECRAMICEAVREWMSPNGSLGASDA